MANRRVFPSFLDLNPVVVGLVSMVAIVALCLMAFAVGALGLTKHTYSMSGVFADSTGISKGADVRMSGVSIGTVSGVHPDYQLGEVIVTWKINNGVHLGTHTSAELDLENLLGGEYVRLSGPVGPPYLDQLPTAQRRIPIERTHTTFTVNGVLGSTALALQQLDAHAINQTLASLAQIVNGSHNDIGSLVTNLGTVAAAVTQRDADLRQLVANSQQITGTLAAKNQQLGVLIQTADGLLRQIADRRDQLATVLGAGSDAVARLSGLIASEQSKLQTILADLHVAIGAASQELPAVDQGFAWAGPTFTDLATIGDHGHWFDVVVTGIDPDASGILTKALGK